MANKTIKKTFKLDDIINFTFYLFLFSNISYILSIHSLPIQQKVNQV